jgi:hypothetical protein
MIAQNNNVRDEKVEEFLFYLGVYQDFIGNMG